MKSLQTHAALAVDEGQQPKPSNHTHKRLLVFHLADQSYAIEVGDIVEVVPMAELSRPPGAPDILAGFLNLGGKPVPVVRLSRLFGLADQPPELYTPLLILRNVDNRIALVVEKVSEIVSVSQENILPVQENHSFNDCTVAVVKQKDRVVLLLSPERILLEKERQAMAEFEAMEQERLCELEESTAAKPQAM